MAKIDKENMKGVLEEFPDQIDDALKLAKNIKVEDINRIVISGMGGSAISGDILKNYLEEDNVEITTNREYRIPHFVDKNTLFFSTSYSGNTEETVSAYREAIRKGAKVVVISSGGKLEELSKMNGNVFIKVPSGIQPRLATGYLFFPMLTVLQNSKIVKDKSSEIKDMTSALKKDIYVDSAQNIAKELAGKIPIIYASERYSSIAMKWKTDINENAKIHAFYNIFPEFNHNEINGYVNKNGEFSVIIIKDNKEHVRVAKRMTIIKELIKSKGIQVIDMAIKGNCRLSKLFSAMYLGVWIAYFLAIEYETDPTPVEIIENLKKELKK